MHDREQERHPHIGRSGRLGTHAIAVARCFLTPVREGGRTAPTSSTRTRVEVPGVGTVGLGDRMELAGGFVRVHPGDGPARGAAPLEVGGVEAPASCARHDAFLTH